MRNNVKLTGFGQVKSFLSNLAKDIRDVQLEEMRQLGLEGEGRVKEHLQKQDLDWAPLQDATLKRKTSPAQGKQRLSEKKLIATTTYFRNITSWASGSRVFIGVKRGVRNASGASVGMIARVHEFGSKKRNIPARPLWQPTLEELRAYIIRKKPFVRAVWVYVKRKYKF